MAVEPLKLDVYAQEMEGDESRAVAVYLWVPQLETDADYSPAIDAIAGVLACDAENRRARRCALRRSMPKSRTFTTGDTCHPSHANNAGIGPGSIVSVEIWRRDPAA